MQVIQPVKNHERTLVSTENRWLEKLRVECWHLTKYNRYYLLYELSHYTFQNVQCWLTCVPTVACGSFSQRYQLLSLVRLTKSTEV